MCLLGVAYGIELRLALTAQLSNRFLLPKTPPLLPVRSLAVHGPFAQNPWWHQSKSIIPKYPLSIPLQAAHVKKQRHRNACRHFGLKTIVDLSLRTLQLNMSTVPA